MKIELVKSVTKPGCLTTIENVPDAALPIVQKYEPLFDDRSVCEDGQWSEFTDLTLVDAEKLKAELAAAGFESVIVEDPYK